MDQRPLKLRACNMLLLLTVGLLCSCTANENHETAERPFEGLTVEVHVPKGLGFKSAWELILDEWSEQTGGTTHLTEVAVDSESVDSENRRPAAAAAANLSFFPLTRVSDQDAAGLLAPFPEDQLTDQALDWLSIFRGIREHVASLQQKPVVLPITCPVLVCYYRADLLEKAGRRVPRTWEDYHQLVRTINDWAPGLTAVEPWNEAYRATMFLARALPYSKHPGQFSLFFDIYTGEPLISTPGFVKALETTLKTLDQMPKTVTEYSPADCRRDILTGRAALAISFETGPGNPDLPFGPAATVPSGPPKPASKKPETQRSPTIRIGFCRLPGTLKVYNRSTDQWESVPGGDLNECTLTAFGGLCAGVTSSSSPRVSQAACHLLATLAIDQIETAFPHGTKSLCRRTQMNAATHWIGTELSADERIHYVEVVAESFRNMAVVAELPVVGRTRFRSTLTAGLSAALSGKQTAQDALRTVNEQWKEIAETIGVETVRDSYRTRLGLAPRPR